MLFFIPELYGISFATSAWGCWRVGQVALYAGPTTVMIAVRRVVEAVDPIRLHGQGQQGLRGSPAKGQS